MIINVKRIKAAIVTVTAMPIIDAVDVSLAWAFTRPTQRRTERG